MAETPTFSLRRLLANAGWLAGGEGLSRIFGLLIALYLARALGSTGYGTIGVAAAMLGFLRIAVRLGTGVIGIRKVAHDPSAIPTVYSEIAGLRVVLALVTVAAVAAASPLIGAALAVPASVLILYACQLLPMAFTPLWAYRGLERMRPIAVARTLEGAFVLVGLLALVRGPDIELWHVPFIHLIAYSALIAWLYLRLSAVCGPLRPRIDVRRWPPLFREGSLISGGVFLETVYAEGDVILLGWLADPATAAQFLVSHKIVLTVFLGARIAQQAAFPATSRLASLSHASAVSLQTELVRYGFIVLMPVIVGLVLLAGPIVDLLFGPGYANAADVLRIASFSLPFAAANESMKRLLLSAIAPRAVFVGRAFGVIAHIAIALVLIPRSGATGAAVACLAGEAIGTVALTLLCARTLGGVPYRPATFAPFAAAIAAAGAGTLAAGLGYPAQIAAVAGVYVSAAFFLGALDITELRRLRARIDAERRQPDLTAPNEEGGT